MGSTVASDMQKIIESYGAVNTYSSITKNFKNIYVGDLLLDIAEFNEETTIGMLYRKLHKEVMNVAGNIEECKLNDR
jgi:hypothetical protein